MIAGEAPPYPGLRAFARDESHLFFGREKDVDELIGRLAATRFLAVIGSSGSGKSSLVRTGLLSALDLGYFARAGAQWVVAAMTPGDQPLANLAQALDEVREGETGAIPVALLRRLLAEGPRSVIQWREAGNLAPEQNLLILVDQFEELFRYGDYAAREEAEAFVTLLLESARQADAHIHIVLTMRSEYLGACALIPGLAEEINRGLYLTPRMSREACRAAIEGPARLAGLAIEPALVNQILNDLAAFAPWEQDGSAAQDQRLLRRSDQLPLMQHLLNRLWLTAEPDAVGERSLTLADYRSLGGLGGALDAHGAEVLAGLSKSDQAAAETVFRTLVAGADPASAVRRPCPFHEVIANLKGDEERARRILDAFRAADCNFIRPPIDVALTHSSIVDISHESLIRQWTVLEDWMKAEVRAAANWDRLASAQARYHEGEGDLLSGLELAALAAWWDAEQPTSAWVDRHGGDHAGIAKFLARSRAAKAEADRRDRLRSLRIMTTVSSLLVIVVIALAYGFIQRQMTMMERETRMLASGFESRSAELVNSLMQLQDYCNRSQDEGACGILREAGWVSALPAARNEATSQLSSAEIDAQASSSEEPELSHAAASTRLYLAGQLDRGGNATQSIASYQEVFDAASRRMERAEAGSPGWIADLRQAADAGYYLAWSRLDANEQAAAAEILARMAGWLAPYDRNPVAPEMRLPLARLFWVQSRLALERDDADENARLDRRVLQLTESPRAYPLDYGPVSRLRIAVLWATEGDSRKASRNEACRIAAELDDLVLGEMTLRLAECDMEAARNALDEDRLEAAEAALSEGRRRLAEASERSPNLDLAVSRITLENVAIDLARKRDGEAVATRLQIENARRFAATFEGATFFQNTTDQIYWLYNGFKDLDARTLSEFEDSGAANHLYVDLFGDIADAIEPSQRAFSGSRYFAVVLAHASMKAANAHNELGEFVDGLGAAERAVRVMQEADLLAQFNDFSEDGAVICGVHARRIEALVGLRRTSEGLAAYAEMQDQCGAWLRRYPWEFYARAPMTSAVDKLGRFLAEEGRYDDALPLLEHASNWGVRASTDQLMAMYRDGLGVQIDPDKAASLATLAGQQSMKRFTVPTDFAGVKYPFHVYVRQYGSVARCPADRALAPEEADCAGFAGIDDQVQWVRIARGGEVPDDVITSFRRLDEIAQENNVAFPDLTVYALGAAQAEAAATTDAEDQNTSADAMVE